MKKLDLYEISEDEVETIIDGMPTQAPPARDPERPCVVVRGHK